MIGRVIDGYRIQWLLGEGGMAMVYYAENNLGKPVAVKVLKEKYTGNEDIRRRFSREADIMMSLENIPGICKVFDRVETEEQEFVLLIEYLKGIDMKKYIERKGPIHNYDALRRFCRQVLTTLGEAHRRGIVHRDIKASNLFLTTAGEVKILDFGISKILFNNQEEQAQTCVRMGAISYMSPEQMLCTADVDLRTDIYSFGATLFYMLTGQDPLGMEEDTLSGIRDPYILMAIRNATRKNRDKRTQTCEQFLQDIYRKR